jgi:two-component system, NarL family, response regulator DesR
VEDNDVFREALELLFGLRPGVEVVAAVGEGEAAVQATLRHRPDVVLMDYRLPGMDGVQATRAILEAAPEVAVVCLTGTADPQETQALYEAGAVACVTKDKEIDTIVDAVVGAVA